MEISPDSAGGFGRQLDALKASAKAPRPRNLRRWKTIILTRSGPSLSLGQLWGSVAFHCGGMFRLYHRAGTLPIKSFPIANCRLPIVFCLGLESWPLAGHQFLQIGNWQSEMLSNVVLFPRGQCPP